MTASRRISLSAIVSAVMVVTLVFLGVQVVQKVLALRASRNVEFPPPSIVLPLGKAPSVGPASAEVALVVYGDLSDDATGHFLSDVLPTLVSRYGQTGRALIAYRHLPLAKPRQDALAAAIAAECAASDGKLWSLLEHWTPFNLEHPTSGADPIGAATAKRVVASGVSRERLDSCLKAEDVRSIHEDAGSAFLLGIRAAPAVLVGALEPHTRSVRPTKIVKGPRSAAAWLEEIDGLLNQKGEAHLTKAAVIDR